MALLVHCKKQNIVSSRYIYKEKNCSLLQKRADFQNYYPREPFWFSFFLSVE